MLSIKLFQCSVKSVANHVLDVNISICFISEAIYEPFPIKSDDLYYL
jgi:hypothetical protein